MTTAYDTTAPAYSSKETYKNMQGASLKIGHFHLKTHFTVLGAMAIIDVLNAYTRALISTVD